MTYLEVESPLGATVRYLVAAANMWVDASCQLGAAPAKASPDEWQVLGPVAQPTPVDGWDFALRACCRGLGQQTKMAPAAAWSMRPKNEKLYPMETVSRAVRGRQPSANGERARRP